MGEQDRKVGITVVAKNDASATFQEIKSDAAVMAAKVEAAGEQAAKGIKEIGGSAEASEAKVERARGRITAELLRVTEQTRIAAEAAGSMARAFEIKAEMRGVDASALAPALAVVRQYESSISVAKAQEAEFIAHNAFAAKAAQAQQLNKASEYTRWWASELEKVDAAERKIASQNGFITSLREQSEAIGKTRADLLELKAAQMGVSTQAAPFIAKMREADGQVGKVGMSARATAAAMAQVPLQFQDIVVSLQGGQAPLTVLLQQGSQLAGTFGGVGAAAKAMGTYVLSLVNPYTVAAAAVAGLGLAYYSGSKEQDEFVKSLILTGNTSGVTTGQLREYAREIDGVVGTEAKAAEGLVAFVNAGVKGGEELRRYTQTAIEWERATGQAVETTAEKFASLQKDPLAAVQKLNEGTNFLTASVYEQVKALQEQGKESEAAQVAMGALDDAMRERAKSIEESLGIIERAWRRIKGEAAEVLDMVRGVGRPPTQLDELLRIRTEISNKEPSLQSSDATVKKQTQERIDVLRKQEWDLMGQLNDEVLGNVAKAADQRALAARTAFDKAYERNKPKSEKKSDELDAWKRQYDKLIEENGYRYSAEQLAQEKAKYDGGVAEIENRYKEKAPGKNGAAKAARDDLSIDINATKRDLEVLTYSYSSAQKIMEAQRAAGLVDDKTYYEEKRKYINLEADAQDKLLQAEMDRYKQEKVTKDNRLQVEKGIADTQAKMDKAKMERSTALKVLSYQETGALNAQKLAMDSLAASHQRALDLMREQAAREVNSAWMGTKERQRSESLQSIKDSYVNEQRQLEDRLLFTPNLSTEQKAQINQRLAYLKEEKAERLRIAQETYTELDSQQSQWEKGAGFAMQNYVDQAANVAQQTADLFTNSFKGMEDALVTFVTTGKLSFSSLATSIVSDITRIIVKQQISNALGVGGTSGGGGGLMGLISTGIGMLTGSATGAQTGAGTMAELQGLGVFAKGDVFTNSASLSSYSNQIHDTPKFFAFAQGAGVFGEAGPEAIMPLTRAPDGNLGVRALSGASAGNTTHINVSVSMPQGGSRETALQFGRTVGRQISVAQSRNG